MVTIKSKSIPDTKDKKSKPIDDDYSTKYFKKDMKI